MKRINVVHETANMSRASRTKTRSADERHNRDCDRLEETLDVQEDKDYTVVDACYTEGEESFVGPRSKLYQEQPSQRERNCENTCNNTRYEEEKSRKGDGQVRRNTESSNDKDESSRTKTKDEGKMDHRRKEYPKHMNGKMDNTISDRDYESRKKQKR